jgi:hypothetical protein
MCEEGRGGKSMAEMTKQIESYLARYESEHTINEAEQLLTREYDQFKSESDMLLIPQQ